MARRGGRGGGKSKEEAKVERLTWLAMAGVFFLLSFIDPENLLADYWIAIVISLILFTSASYQQVQKFSNSTWNVNPFTWIIAALLGGAGIWEAVAAARSWFSLPFDLRLISLGVVVGIILLGVITNET
jgi:hypothetical protein